MRPNCLSGFAAPFPGALFHFTGTASKTSTSKPLSVTVTGFPASTVPENSFSVRCLNGATIR